MEDRNAMPKEATPDLSEIISSVAWAPTAEGNMPYGMVLSDEDIGRIANIVLATRSAALAHPGQVREIAIKPLEKAAEALKPLADAVFNDNGDMTVSVPLINAEQCIKAYFAVKKIRSALALSLPVQESEPEGWQLVPKEPTEEMLDAYWEQTGESKEMRPRTHAYMRRYYAAMLAAAPLSPSPIIPEEKGGTAESVVGWRTIETAPKDRTRILLWHEGWLHIVMGYWSPTINAWLEYGSRDAKANIATHWMPLPASPTEGQTVKEGSTDE